jgi:trigger factor
MKTEFVDVTDTKKNLVVEIPSAVVDAEIERVARDYSRAARIPGFRPGKVPQKLVRQRFRDQILNDVAHDLIPRAVDEALRERGIEPVDTPDIRDVLVEEGQPLKFTASFDTVPPIDPGDYATIRLARPPVTVPDADVDQALERLRDRAARYEPVEGRGIENGDTVVLDLDRRSESNGETDHHENVSVDIGAQANPPGFDEELIGLDAGAEKGFTIRYRDDYAIRELAGTTVTYEVRVKEVKRRVVPALDDEFAKDMGDFETLDALRDRVRADLQHEAEHAADRQLRNDLLKALAGRVGFEVPDALIEREMDRRVEEFARRLMDQQIDPRTAQIDWNQFRDSQRDAAREAVASALVLDEVSRREQLDVSEADVNQEIEGYATRSGRTAAAVRARLEKEGGLSRLYSGLRRERALDFVLSRASVNRD